MTRDEQNELEDLIGDQRDPLSVCAVCDQPIRRSQLQVCEQTGCYEPMHKDCIPRCGNCYDRLCPAHLNEIHFVRGGRYTALLCSECTAGLFDLDSPAALPADPTVPSAGAGDAGAGAVPPSPFSEQERT